MKKKLLLLFLLSFSLIGIVYADNELRPSKKQCNDLFKTKTLSMLKITLT
ncbi:hypothetical protein ABXT44_07830 [Candidatus Pseudothioglobus sp. Uisw_041]